MRARRGSVLLVAGALALLPGLAGCGRSPGTQFFMLSAVRPDAAPRAVPGRVQLRAVHIPALLDRTERVSALSDERLQINQFQQWGAPLADMIRSVLSQDLAARLPPGTVVPPTAPPAPATRGLVVDVQEFLPEADGTVVLQATWSLLAAAGTTPADVQGGNCESVRSALGGKQADRGGAAQAAATAVSASGSQQLMLAAGGGADAQVRAMSQLLGRLADAIAAGVSGSAPDHP